MFDTKSGVLLVALRATLGLSETVEDQIEALASYGLVEGDYTRDKIDLLLHLQVVKN